MRLKAANHAIIEEGRLHDQLLETQNDNNLKLAKASQAKEQFEENIKRGQELLEKVENAFSIQMIDMQKGRQQLDDADVDLTYLQDEYKSFKERKRQQE